MLFKKFKNLPYNTELKKHFHRYSSTINLEIPDINFGQVLIDIPKMNEILPLTLSGTINDYIYICL